jgi:predicted N-acyltransferase
VWGRQYLTKAFFELLAASDFVENLVFLCARPSSTGSTLRAEDVLAGTFSTWGCFPMISISLVTGKVMGS